MNFELLRQRVYEAIQAGGHEEAHLLLAAFCAGNPAPADLARAWDLKAYVLLLPGETRAPDALRLREEALKLADTPGLQAYLLVGLLRTVRIMGDVDRSVVYERQALSLLWHHTGDPEVARYRPFLHQACGRAAHLRGEHTIALWQFLRAEEAYQDAVPDDAIAWACYRAGNFISLFDEYMRVGRRKDARDALNQARAICPRERPGSWAGVAAAEIRWALEEGDAEQARQWLADLEACYGAVPSPDLEATLHLLAARVAFAQQLPGDGLNRLQRAEAVAVEHRLDARLAEIQRCYRALRPLIT